MGVKKKKLIIEETLKIYLWVIVIIFTVLLIRVGWLQLLQTEAFRTMAVSNTMRLIPETAPRGDIVDSQGNVIATNRPVYNLSLDYLGLKDQDTDKVIEKLVQILNDPDITFENIKNAIKDQRNRLFEPIIIKRDIPIELVTVIEERRRELPGVSINVQPQRSYNYGSLAGHLLGYVHSIKEELEQQGFEEYGLGDLVGKTGVEKTYEHYLRGENGYKQVEVTATNRPVREIENTPAKQGDTLVLTIDIKLQQAMEKAFDETMEKLQKKHPKAKAGAAVLLDVKTGKVLAMVSRPTLNPDDFNGKPLNQEQVDYYFRDIPTGLRNRAIQGNYVPGSTFKPITGMAVLEAGKVDPTDSIVCTGRYWYPPFIKCTKAHGRVDFYSAMASSCNTYFQEMARRAGIAQIGRVGMEFGLGKATGIDLPYENTGLLPHLEWQKEEFLVRADKINKRIDNKLTEIEESYQEKIAQAATESEKKRLQRELNSKKIIWERERKIQLDYYTTWHDFDTYNTGIGQGYNQYTIIQLANYAATIANGGDKYKPYVVDKIVAYDGEIVMQNKPELINSVTVKKETIETVHEAMNDVTKPGGTAHFLFYKFPKEIQVAAKTGTAQPGREGYIKNKDYDGLFIAFAPVDDPQIAFAGVMEHGWSGGGSVGYVAKAVFEQYFGLNQQELN